jgi:hypothetical protein
MKIFEVYEQLSEMSICRSAYEFSRTYLKRNQSYYSVLKVKQAEPPIETWVMLERTLKQRSEQFSQSAHSSIQHAGRALSELAAQVTCEIEKQMNQPKQ